MTTFHTFLRTILAEAGREAQRDRSAMTEVVVLRRQVPISAAEYDTSPRPSSPAGGRTPMRRYEQGVNYGPASFCAARSVLDLDTSRGSREESEPAAVPSSVRELPVESWKRGAPPVAQVTCALRHGSNHRLLLLKGARGPARRRGDVVRDDQRALRLGPHHVSGVSGRRTDRGDEFGWGLR